MSGGGLGGDGEELAGHAVGQIVELVVDLALGVRHAEPGSFSSSSVSARGFRGGADEDVLPVMVALVALMVASASRFAPIARARSPRPDVAAVLPLSAWASRRLPALRSMVLAFSDRSPELALRGAGQVMPPATSARSRVEMVTFSSTVIHVGDQGKSAPSVVLVAAHHLDVVGGRSAPPPAVGGAGPSAARAARSRGRQFDVGRRRRSPRRHAPRSAPAPSVAVSPAKIRMLPPSEGRAVSVG